MCLFWEQQEVGIQGVPPQGLRIGGLAELLGLFQGGLNVANWGDLRSPYAIS